MPIFVTCPQCSRTLQGREEDAGKQTRCPACGNVLTLPEQSEPPPVTAGPSGTSWSPSPPVPSAGPPGGGRAGAAPPLYTCRDCTGAFGINDVYDQNGSIICKRCYAAAHGGTLGYEGSYGGGYGRGYREEPYVRSRVPHVHSYMTEAILCTIFCGFCLIPLAFGIVAIVKAAEVNSSLAVGDYRRAVAASDSAKTWCGLSFGLGLAGGIILVLITASGGMR